MNVLFKQAANIYENNKDFQSGLVVALPKAAVAKEISGSNAKKDLQVHTQFCTPDDNVRPQGCSACIS